VRKEDSRINHFDQVGQVKVNNKGIKMTGNNRHIPISTLDVNGLNAPIKRHRIANWIIKQDPTT
jgi:hypothetical protein